MSMTKEEYDVSAKLFVGSSEKVKKKLVKLVREYLDQFGVNCVVYQHKNREWVEVFRTQTEFTENDHDDLKVILVTMMERLSFKESHYAWLEDGLKSARIKESHGPIMIQFEKEKLYEDMNEWDYSVRDESGKLNWRTYWEVINL